MKFVVCLLFMLSVSTAYGQKEKLFREERNVASFNKIHVSAALPVEVSYSQELKVEVYAVDSSRAKEIVTRVVDGCLYLSTKEPLRKKTNWLYMEGREYENQRKTKDKIKLYIPVLVEVTQGEASSVSLLGNWRMDKQIGRAHV